MVIRLMQASGGMQRARALMRSASPGMTLFELLVVLAILSLIAVIATPQVARYLGSARSETALVQVRSLSAAIDLFRLDVGRYPTQQEGLDALVNRPAGVEGWNGPYIRQRSALADPWGQPYLYKVPGDHSDFDIFTLGADRTAGGTGENRDLGNWN